MSAEILRNLKSVWRHPKYLRRKKVTFSEIYVPMEYRNDKFCETKRLMHYLLGQNLLNLQDNPSGLSRYALCTKTVNLYAFIKQMLAYQAPVTIKNYVMRASDERITESIKIVSVHFKVNKQMKSISIPEDVSLAKKPKRTLQHIQRLKKHNFHIQSAIA